MPGYLVIWKLLKPVNLDGFIVSYVTQRVSPGIPRNRTQLSYRHQSKQELKLVTRKRHHFGQSGVIISCKQITWHFNGAL